MKCPAHKSYLASCGCKMPDKGQQNGSCNVQNCQDSGATWYNRVMDAWYCPECAMRINHAQRSNKDIEDREPICSPG